MVATQVYALFHDPLSLRSAPTHPRIKAIDLNKLTLDSRWNTNLLAEARFFLSREGTTDLPEWIGVASARFDEKFSHGPTLEKIVSRVGLIPNLPKNMLFAPLIMGGAWWETRDEVTPGMTNVLEQIIAHFSLTKLDGKAPFCNTFICHRTRYLELCQFLEEALSFSLDTWGENIPFSYRCHCCGTSSLERIGRYGRERHWGFLAECLTALFFTRAEGLRVVDTSHLFLRGLAKGSARRLWRHLDSATDFRR